MTFRRLLRFGVAALLSMALAGCWFTGEREHQAGDYVAALADSLAVAPQTSSIPTVEPLPRSRYRRQDLPELDMGLVDFLSLYGCDLQVVIGERTSTLGRVAPPGKRMAYHLRFLEAADDCLPKVESESRSKALEEARAARADGASEGCPGGIRAQAFFREHYLDGLAARVQRVRQQGRRMAGALDRLVRVTGAPVPDAMMPFINRNLRKTQSSSVWYDLDQAVERHAAAWNRLLSRCD